MTPVLRAGDDIKETCRRCSELRCVWAGLRWDLPTAQRSQHSKRPWCCSCWKSEPISSSFQSFFLSSQILKQTNKNYLNKQKKSKHQRPCAMSPHVLTPAQEQEGASAEPQPAAGACWSDTGYSMEGLKEIIRYSSLKHTQQHSAGQMTLIRL